MLRRDGVLNYSSLSNSYATPVVTAAAIDALKENPTMNVYEVIEKIKSRSKEFLIYKAPQIFEKGTEDMLETPVVMVRLKDISVQDELVRSLKEQFIKKGYNAFCSYSFSKDKNRLPSDRLINYLLYIQKFYRSDIIILSYTDQKPYSDFHSYDVVISDYSMNNFDFMYHAGKLIEFSDLNNSITVINKILNEFEEGAM